MNERQTILAETCTRPLQPTRTTAVLLEGRGEGRVPDPLWAGDGGERPLTLPQVPEGPRRKTAVPWNDRLRGADGGG